MKESIPYKTTLETLKRCSGHCEGCGSISDGTLHHIFYKSQYYGKDRNLSWNLANLCERCHRIIHHASTDQEIKDKNKLDYKLKSAASGRYHGLRKPEILQMVKRAFIKQNENRPKW